MLEKLQQKQKDLEQALIDIQKEIEVEQFKADINTIEKIEVYVQSESNSFTFEVNKNNHKKFIDLLVGL
jgi:hypothetical protein